MHKTWYKWKAVRAFYVTVASSFFARSVPFLGSPQVGIRLLVVALCLTKQWEVLVCLESTICLFDMRLKMTAISWGELTPNPTLTFYATLWISPPRNPWWIMERFIRVKPVCKVAWTEHCHQSCSDLFSSLPTSTHQHKLIEAISGSTRLQCCLMAVSS